MAQDLRQLALLSADQLEKLSEEFPVGEPGRRALKTAVRQLKAFYVWGTPTKLKIVLLAITQGNRRLGDIAAVTGFDRREVCSLTSNLIKRGLVVEARERSAGVRGRPFKIFQLTDKGAACLN